jgi:hypothetical protein
MLSDRTVASLQFYLGAGEKQVGSEAQPINAVGDHPLVARREAPHNKRIQQTIPPANKFASGLAPDPQRVRLGRL